MGSAKLNFYGRLHHFVSHQGTWAHSRLLVEQRGGMGREQLDCSMRELIGFWFRENPFAERKALQ